MRGYGVSLTRIFPYETIIEDFVLKYGQKKPVFSHILHSVLYILKKNILTGAQFCT